MRFSGYDERKARMAIFENLILQHLDGQTNEEETGLFCSQTVQDTGRRARFSACIGLFLSLILTAPYSFGDPMPEALNRVIENHCADCHDDLDPKGGLDLFSLEWDLKNPHPTERWVKVHDLLAAGEMPPKKKSRLGDAERAAVVEVLADRIVEEQEAAYVQHGRSVSRRVNRFEYQNVLRDLLHDPTLKVADQLPLDGEVHGFAKVGSALDVSHVQVDAYLDVAELALRRSAGSRNH